MNPRLYWQIHQLSSLYERRVDETLKSQAGFGFAQYKVLEAISRNSLARQNTIAELLDQTEASISRQVKILGKQDAIIVGTVMDNRRARELSLTEKGERMLQEADSIIARLESRFLSELDLSTQEQLQTVLSILQRNI